MVCFGEFLVSGSRPGDVFYRTRRGRAGEGKRAAHHWAWLGEYRRAETALEGGDGVAAARARASFNLITPFYVDRLESTHGDQVTRAARAFSFALVGKLISRSLLLRERSHSAIRNRGCGHFACNSASVYRHVHLSFPFGFGVSGVTSTNEHVAYETVHLILHPSLS